MMHRFCAMQSKGLELMRMHSPVWWSQGLRRISRSLKRSITRETVFTLKMQWPRKSQGTIRSSSWLCWGSKIKVIALAKDIHLVFGYVGFLSCDSVNFPILSMLSWFLQYLFILVWTSILNCYLSCLISIINFIYIVTIQKLQKVVLKINVKSYRWDFRFVV